MRKLLCFAFVFLSALAFGQTTATVSGNLVDQSETGTSSGISVDVTLVNTGSQRCFVAGTGTFVAEKKNYTAAQILAGITLAKTANITCGSSSGQTRWRFSFKNSTLNTSRDCDLQISGATSLNTATCLQATTTPTTTVPTSSLYWLLDGSNSPTGNLVPAVNGTQSIGTSGSRWNMFANTMDVSGNETVGGTLGVTGTSTLAATNISRYSRDCRTDGTMDVTGVADSSAVINTCIAAAKANAQSKIIIPCGNFLINTTLNATNFPGLRITGCGFQPNISSGPIAGTKETNLLCNTGSTTWCLEAVGSSGLEIDHLTMTLCCSAGYASLTNPSRGGILQGRDNAGGGGAANPFCYSEQNIFHDIYITDNGGANTTFNNSRGQVGIYNVAAEDGIYLNTQILSGTPMVFSQTDILGGGSVYQTLGTGCPASMVDEVLTKVTLAGSTVTLPLVEANITNSFTINGILGNGGAGIFKFENLSGAAVTADWNVQGAYENAAADIISTSVNLDNMHLNLQVSSPAPGVDVKMLANNITISNSQLLFGHLAGVTPDVFINNTATGTIISGSILMIGGTTSASNTTVNNSTVYAPFITDANITFAAASNYEYLGSSGIITHGQRKFAIGTVGAPGISFNTSTFPGLTGFYVSATNGLLQLSYGGTANVAFSNNTLAEPVGMVTCWSSNADPNNASCDTGISRDAAGTVDVGTGAAGSTAGRIKTAAIVSGGAAATLTGTGACATTSTQTGGSMAGRATCTGVTAASTLTITPGTTAPNGWVCSAYDQTTRANLLQQTATVAASCTLTATSVTQNDVIVFTAIAF